MIESRRGAAAALVILWIPVLLTAAAVAVETGRLLSARYELQAAMDLAALAGAQSVDWDALAEGHVVLCEDEAAAKALQYAEQNVINLSGEEPGSVEVWVINTSEDDPALHPITGAEVQHPTVVVRCEAPGPESWFDLWRHPITLVAEADAALRPREDG